MTNGTKPLRQEMTEISTATLEGADCFMLTHETSVGKNPVEAATFLAKAVAEAEGIYDYEQAYVNVKDEVKNKGVNI